MDSGSPDPAPALRCVGLRVPATRLAVHTALTSSEPHSSVNAAISIVYNMLHTFTHVGLVRTIKPAKSVGLYERRVGNNHHIVCHRYKASAVGDIPCLTATDDSDHEIDKAEVVYWDQYPECVAATSISFSKLERTRSVRHQQGGTALAPEQK